MNKTKNKSSPLGVLYLVKESMKNIINKTYFSSEEWTSKCYWNSWCKADRLEVEVCDYGLQFSLRSKDRKGFPCGSAGKEFPRSARDPGSISGSGRGRRKQQPTPVFLPGESHGQRSQAGYSLWGCKDSDRTEQPTLSKTERENMTGMRNFLEEDLRGVREQAYADLGFNRGRDPRAGVSRCLPANLWPEERECRRNTR